MRGQHGRGAPGQARDSQGTVGRRAAHVRRVLTTTLVLVHAQMLNFSEPARVPPVPDTQPGDVNAFVHQSLPVQLRGERAPPSNSCCNNPTWSCAFSAPAQQGCALSCKPGAMNSWRAFGLSCACHRKRESTAVAALLHGERAAGLAEKAHIPTVGIAGYPAHIPTLGIAGYQLPES